MTAGAAEQGSRQGRGLVDHGHPPVWDDGGAAALRGWWPDGNIPADPRG